MNKHAQKQHALTANSNAYARCLMQVAVAVRAATDQRRRPAPESLTVRSKSFAHGAYASTIGGRLRTSSDNLAVLRLPT
jgi:hypothetical protein